MSSNISMLIRNFCLLLIAALAIGSCTDTPVTPPSDNNPGGTVNTTTLTLEDLYDVAPNVAACSEGRLRSAERTKVLAYVNAIRANGGLPPVQYRAEDDRRVDRAALMIAATSTLNHTPPSTVTCWSQEGYDGSSTSNLAIMMPYGEGKVFAASESFVDLWMKDSLVTGLGHRRWLLDPFLKYIAFGRVDRSGGVSTFGATGAAIRVIHAERQDLSQSTLEYVAFPYHETSTHLFNSGLEMSFSAVADRTDFWKNDEVDYSAAAVEIRDPSGAIVPATKTGTDASAYGLANLLTWKAPVSVGVRYTVSVRGVRVQGVAKSWEYWFRLAPVV